jgi:cation:H+ antiporter
MMNLLWTFPVLMFASIAIGWAAEITAVHLSAGIALAVLAWLQTAPEFAVEATIAWSRNTHLALANLTGSLRLLMGLGWPMVFFIHWASHGRKNTFYDRSVKLTENFSVEALGLFSPLVYFFFIYLKGTWSATDGIILCSFYAIYFLLLNLERKSQNKTKNFEEAIEEDDDEPWVVRKILSFSKKGQIFSALGIFIFGGILLLKTVHPFVEALKETALALGISTYVFIQWVAPVASEFPEKVTAFGWARKPKKVSFALVNMLSSVTSQWTLLAGLIPLVFSLSAKQWFTIELDEFQRQELLLTLAQSFLALVFLLDLKIKSYEALGLFILWAVQFFVSETRVWLTVVYFSWSAIELLRLMTSKEQLSAIRGIKHVLRVLKKN